MTQTASALATEYETVYVLRPDVTADGARKIATRIEELTARQGGRLTRVDTWGRRALAYPVKNHKRGVYICLKYLAHGGLVAEIERNLRMLDDVLKFQTLRLRKGVETAGFEIKPEDVRFDEIQPPTAADADESIERALGLEPPERAHVDHDRLPMSHEPAARDDAEAADDEDEEAQDEETEEEDE
ncbi:MAG TPA: 30S ribosomal protein S6 [Polyangiaceae bacterium]|jgi:small subunit ribosomal protein S6